VDLSFLPTLNACLNGLATLLLVVGLWLIKTGKRDAHRNCMISAFGISIIFLICYLVHKAWKASTGQTMHTSYNGEGLAKTFYLLILATHLILAMIVPVFAIMLTRWGLRGQFDKHRKLAKWAWPIWFYVSVTGVVIYLMLYPFNPPLPGN